MFQNISREDTYNSREINENKILLLMKELFKPLNCMIYIITFLISMVELKDNVLPFGLAMIAGCMGSTIPIFLVYIISGLSILIFHGGVGFAGYFYTSLIFFILLFIFKPKISVDDRNEVFKLGTRLFFATFIYYLIKDIKGNLLAYNIFMDFVISALTYAFYKIFVNRDGSNKRYFNEKSIYNRRVNFNSNYFLYCSISI